MLSPNMKTILLSLLILPTLAHAGGIFWSDRPTSAKAIRGCNFDRSNVRNIVALASTRDPRGVMVDAANERLYFCDRVGSTATSGEINYVAISGAGRRAADAETLNRPADLRFDPVTRTAYWCEENGGLIRNVVLPSAGGAIPLGECGDGFLRASRRRIISISNSSRDGCGGARARRRFFAGRSAAA